MQDRLLDEFAHSVMIVIAEVMLTNVFRRKREAIRAMYRFAGVIFHPLFRSIDNIDIFIENNYIFEIYENRLPHFIRRHDYIFKADVRQIKPVLKDTIIELLKN